MPTGPEVSSGLVPRVTRIPLAARSTSAPAHVLIVGTSPDDTAGPDDTCRTSQSGPCANGSHGDLCFSNLLNPSIGLHFSRPRSRLVPSTDRFNAGFPSRKRPRLGHSQNTERTSHVASRGAGVDPEIIPSVSLGSLFPSVTRPTTPIWVGPCPIFTHALTHALSFAPLTRLDTLQDNHSGCLG